MSARVTSWWNIEPAARHPGNLDWAFGANVGH
jgi:hypothetical protein